MRALLLILLLPGCVMSPGRGLEPSPAAMAQEAALAARLPSEEMQFRRAPAQSRTPALPGDPSALATRYEGPVGLVTVMIYHPLVPMADAGHAGLARDMLVMEREKAVRAMIAVAGLNGQPSIQRRRDFRSSLRAMPSVEMECGDVILALSQSVRRELACIGAAGATLVKIRMTVAHKPGEEEAARTVMTILAMRLLAAVNDQPMLPMAPRPGSDPPASDPASDPPGGRPARPLDPRRSA